MLKITDIFKARPQTFSFEIFPPKTDKGMVSLEAALEELTRLPFDFVSVTYGAGGSSRDKTCGIVRLMQEEYRLPALHHFTCVRHSRDEIRAILDELKRLGINNILALRGDPPKDDPSWVPGPNNFRYSSELVAFVRRHFGDHFSIGVAGFPEGHMMAESLDADADVLRKKINAGGDFVMTQLFFDNELYFAYVRRLRALGVTARVIPGILPVTSYESVVNFCKGCGASVPSSIHDIFAPIAADKDKTFEAGVRFAVDQCRELLAGGAEGIHFYTLNKAEPVTTIIRQLAQA
jgi:methylenetetrahydrofolate reductase (NADPH)